MTDFEIALKATEVQALNLGSGTLNLAHQTAFARTPYLSPVPLATCSLLRAAYQRVRALDEDSLAAALARLAGAPSLPSRFAVRDSGGSSGVLFACAGCPIRLRFPGSSRRTVLGTLR